MKNGLNRTQLLGNVGAEDARLGTMPDGSAVINFSFAVNESWVEQATGEEKQSTDWFKIAIYGKRASSLAPFVTSGKGLYLEGKITAKAWQPKNEQSAPTGEPRADLILKVDRLIFLDGNRRDSPMSGEVNGEAAGGFNDDPGAVSEKLFPNG